MSEHLFKEKMNMDASEYFLYLKNRSFLGLLYRKLFLYPLLKSYLKGRLLDIGCGIGDMLISRSNSVGVDVNSHNIEFCRKKGLEAYVMEAEKLPFESNSFDSIILDNVLEHIKNPTNIILEIKRTLKHEGVLLIGVPGIKGFASDLDHKTFYNENDLANLALKSGFEVNHFFYMPFFKSEFLSRKLRQYALYTVWIKR